MGAFIIAGIVFGIGVLGFFAAIAVYMSYPAPSVQGDASAPWVWLIGCSVVAALVAGSHWLPHIGW